MRWIGDVKECPAFEDAFIVGAIADCPIDWNIEMLQDYLRSRLDDKTLVVGTRHSMVDDSISTRTSLIYWYHRVIIVGWGN